MKLLTFILLSSLLMASPQAHSRGNEGRGIEDLVILAKTYVRKLDKNGHVYMKVRKESIREQLTSTAGKKSRAQRITAEFFRQVDGTKLLEPEENPVEKIKDIRPLYKKLQDLGAADAIENSDIVFKDVCYDEKNVERTIVSQPIPGSEICVNLDRMALFDFFFLIDQIDRYNQHEISMSTEGIVFAALIHEVARQYKEDNDHELMYAMRREAYARVGINRHFLKMIDGPSGTYQTGVGVGSSELPHLLMLGMDYTKDHRATLRLKLLHGAHPECLKDSNSNILLNGSRGSQNGTYLRLSQGKSVGEVDYVFHKLSIKDLKNYQQWGSRWIHEITVDASADFIKLGCASLTQIELIDENKIVVLSTLMSDPLNPQFSQAPRITKVYRFYSLKNLVLERE